MQTPNKFTSTLSTNLSHNKIDLFAFQLNTTKNYINISKYTPNDKLFNKQIGEYDTPVLTPRRYSQKYYNAGNKKQKEENKEKIGRNAQKIFNINDFALTQVFKNKGFAYNTPSHEKKKISIVSTPNTQKSRVMRDLFTSVDAHEHRNIRISRLTYETNKNNQEIKANLQNTIEKRSYSANKRNKYLTVISRMPANKKRICIQIQ